MSNPEILEKYPEWLHLSQIEQQKFLEKMCEEWYEKFPLELLGYMYSFEKALAMAGITFNDLACIYYEGKPARESEQVSACRTKLRTVMLRSIKQGKEVSWVRFFISIANTFFLE